MSKISKAVKKVDMEGVIRAIVRLGQAAPGPPPGSCPGTGKLTAQTPLPVSSILFPFKQEERNCVRFLTCLLLNVLECQALVHQLVVALEIYFGSSCQKESVGSF